MAKVGPNAPCPCGSGKKYKKCCMAADKAAKRKGIKPPKIVFVDDDDLDELSNSVVDLVHEGRLDEAEAACKKLLDRYPEVPDGLERMAMVEEARGNRTSAASYYRKAADFVHGAPGYDPQMAEFYKQKAAVLEKDPKPR